MARSQKKTGSQALRCDRYPSLIVQGTVGEGDDATPFSVSFVNGLAEVEDPAVASAVLELTETDSDELLVTATDETVPAVEDPAELADPAADNTVVNDDEPGE